VIQPLYIPSTKRLCDMMRERREVESEEEESNKRSFSLSYELMFSCLLLLHTTPIAAAFDRRYRCSVVMLTHHATTSPVCVAGRLSLLCVVILGVVVAAFGQQPPDCMCGSMLLVVTSCCYWWWWLLDKPNRALLCSIDWSTMRYLGYVHLVVALRG
jgi:hypothetical protein